MKLLIDRFTIEDLDKVASQLLNKTQCKTIALHGNLGVGKTSLIKAIVNVLGGQGSEVTSPSYSIINDYDSDKGKIYHIDCYRLKHSTEALDLGIMDYLSEDAWIIIEWPEVILNLLPQRVVNSYLKINVDGSRSLYI